MIEDEAVRLDLVRVLAVVSLLDGVAEQAKLELALDVASALHVHADFVDALQQLARNDIRWVVWTRSGRTSPRSPACRGRR